MELQYPGTPLSQNPLLGMERCGGETPMASFPKRNWGVKGAVSKQSRNRSSAPLPCALHAGLVPHTEQGQRGAPVSLESVNGTEGTFLYIVILPRNPSQNSDTHELSLEVGENRASWGDFNIKCTKDFAAILEELEMWVPLHPMSAACGTGGG